MAVPLRRYILVGKQLSLTADIAFALKRRCPVCRAGKLFKPWSLNAVDSCTTCQTHLGAHDVGDGAAVLLIFLLGFTLAPAAWAFELAFAPPLWVHAAGWGTVALLLIALILPAAKAYVILLEYRHRPGEWGK